MTAQRDLKRIIRERKKKTGESYSTARTHVLRAQAALLGLPPGSLPPIVVEHVDAIVLKVGPQSLRVRMIGASHEVTFRANRSPYVVPGHVVTLVVEKAWVFRGAHYASGKVEKAWCDIAKLGLIPLPLSGGEMEDLRDGYEPYRRPDPYAPLWRKLTAQPRAVFEMDAIAWGSFPDQEPDDNPTFEAAELVEMGDIAGAQKLLMETLHKDLRCLDAHAQLGNRAFDLRPEWAMMHYEVGVRIGELSLPPAFDGVMPWGLIYNRPFLRCLQGYGLCLWRLGRLAEGLAVFERILSLNPNDNQGIRACWEDVRNGKPWEDDEAASSSSK